MPTKSPQKKTGAATTKSAAQKSKSPASGTSQKKAQDSALMEFFTDELKDIYWAEKHLVKTLPKMKKAAASSELADAIAAHLEETKVQVSRLEEVFAILGKKPQAKKCDAMEGITTEGSNIIEETEEGTATRDVGIVLAGQKVEHYEIATYGGLAQLAYTLGLDDVAALLEESLEEEKAADETLTQIAESGINYAAATEEVDEEENEEEE